MFKWKPDFETGVGFIDEQHEKLFEIGNKVYELLKNNFVTDKYDKILDIVQELKNYTAFHFASEEEYLLKIGYKGFLAHKVEHDDFIKKFNDIDLRRIDNGQDSYIMDIMSFLSDWISEHILVKDQHHSHK
ncbi:bacteriohemerythrin [Clostridium swellfunianum]|uniref:bacteriohemerythrin n=1 Tax=Clostridium swellfunianum TaxID=1367462 RepID=UPI00202F8BA4|nr:bacteriohemerythrin [Clostridium swellfunianum]MCM0647099.1 bacteriohemerythrin [Clostridium swellfunianum]